MLVGDAQRLDAVESIGAHLAGAVFLADHIPSLLISFGQPWRENNPRLRTRACEAGVGEGDKAVIAHSLEHHRQKFTRRGDILHTDALRYGRSVGDGGIHSIIVEHPVGQRLVGIGPCAVDIVSPGRVAMDVDVEEALDGASIIEECALQDLLAVGERGSEPLAADLLAGDAVMARYGVDEPHVAAEKVSYHVSLSGFSRKIC